MLMTAAGRPTTTIGSSPATFSAACDVGMTSRKQAPRPPPVPVAVRKTMKRFKMPFCSWESVGKGWMRPLENGGVEVEAAETLLALRPVASCDFDLRLRALAVQHSDPRNADRRFHVVFGAAGPELYAVGVDANDAVLTVERWVRGSTTRLATVPEPSLASGIVELVVVARGNIVRVATPGAVLATLAIDVPDGRVGIMVAKARCVVEFFGVRDLQLEAIAAASGARAAAARAVHAALAAARVARHAKPPAPPAPLPPIPDPPTDLFRAVAGYDVGKLCQGCGGPFTRVGEPMRLWKRRNSTLRFHPSCFGDDNARSIDYADAWLRARIAADDNNNARAAAASLLNNRRRHWLPTPGELVRAGAAALETPDGTKILAGPLSAEAYARLLRTAILVVDQDDDDDDSSDCCCPICFHPLRDLGGLVLRLPCATTHAFHVACLRPWFRRCSLCPTCRTDIRPLIRPASDFSSSKPRRRPSTTMLAVARLRPRPAKITSRCSTASFVLPL